MAQGVGEIAWALVGGVCGAVVADRTARAGMRSERAALAVAVGGGLAGMVLPGKARWVAVGASAACAGELALMWLQARAAEARPEDPLDGGGKVAHASKRMNSSADGGEEEPSGAPVMDMPASTAGEHGPLIEAWPARFDEPSSDTEPRDALRSEVRAHARDPEAGEGLDQQGWSDAPVGS